MDAAATLKAMLDAQLARQGVPLRAAARQMKLTPGTIRSVWRGEHPPTEKTLERLARFLALPVDEVRALAQAAHAPETTPDDSGTIEATAARPPSPEEQVEITLPALLPRPVETMSGVKLRETATGTRWGCNNCAWLALCLEEVNLGFFAWCEESLEGEVLWQYGQVQFFTSRSILVSTGDDVDRTGGDVAAAQTRAEVISGVPAL